MPSIATSNRTIGDVVKHEDLTQWGICRTQATVLAATGMQIGSVLESDGDGTYSWVEDADVAGLPADVGILIDEGIYDGVTGDRTLTLLNIPVPGANAVIAKNTLSYGDAVSAPNQVIVEAALAARGILLVDQV